MTRPWLKLLVPTLVTVDAACWVLVTVSWSGLVLAETAHFSGAGTFVFAAILLAGLILGLRRRPRPTPRHEPSNDVCDQPKRICASLRVALEIILVGLVLAQAAAVYLRSGEMIFSTHDAGVRFESAANLASTGKIEITVPDYAVGVHTGSLEYALGTYEIDASRGILHPQFSGVTEMWGALALATTNGPAGLFLGYRDPPIVFPQRALYVSGIFALASVALLFLTLRQVLGFLVAWTAMAGVALSYPEIYYARLTMSEIVEQLFFFVALYGVVRYWKDGRVRHAVLAGFGVGLSVLTHLDAVLVYFALITWLSVTAARHTWSKGHTAIAGTSLILLIQAIWHYLSYAPLYVLSNVAPVINFALGSSTAVILMGAVAALLVGILVAAHAGQLDRIAQSNRTRIGLAALIVIGGLALYVVRPILQPPSIVLAADGSVDAVMNAGVTWVTIGRYLLPVTLGASLLGIVGSIVRMPSRLTWSLLLVGGVFATFLSLNSFVSPHQPFWVRRFLPVVIPTLVIFAAIGASIFSLLIRPRRVQAVSAAALSLALVLCIASAGRPLWTIQPEFQGALSQTNNFAHALPANSIIIADQGAIATWLPLPLSLLFHRETFLLVPSGLDDQRLDDAFQTWWNEGKAVVFVTDGGQSSLNPRRWAFQKIVGQTFAFPQLKPDYWSPPTSLQKIAFDATAYRVVPLDQRAPPTFPFDLKVASADYGYLISGFQRAYGDGTEPYRWTDAEAVVDLPRPNTTSWKLTVQLKATRPPGVPRAHLVMTLDDRPLKTIDFGSEPVDRWYANFVDIVINGNSEPTSTSGMMRLKFTVNSWRPSDLGFNDARELGVAIREIRVDAQN
jgi:hypothetical protein